jgi:hypothetical protein
MLQTRGTVSEWGNVHAFTDVCSHFVAYHALRIKALEGMQLVYALPTHLTQHYGSECQLLVLPYIGWFRSRQPLMQALYNTS